MSKVTLKQWEKSGLDLNKFLTFPVEIDEALYNYLAECTAPQYCYNGLIQSGEAEYSDKQGVMYYMSCSFSCCKYYYLGILPEFVQELS